MSDSQVVTELTIDPSGAVDGSATFAQAMAAASAAANDNLKTVADRTAAVNQQLDGMGKAAQAANDNNGHLTIGLKQVAQGALEAAESFAKKAAIAAVVVGVMGALLNILLPIYTAYKLIKLAIDLVTEAWELGNAKLAEYVALSEKAVASGVSTDFFQRITKAATDAKTPVDALTASMKTLNEATSDKLGGTDPQKQLDALTKAGNFKGNTGASQLAEADTTEQKFRAISSLIDQAMQKGERLAALDVAKSFLGDAVAANLATDSDYLNKMIAAADQIKQTDLIPQSSVDNAVALQNRLDAAEKILSQRWHPIQDLLTQGGIAMKEAWVSIVEAVASAVDWVAKLIEKIGQIPSWFYTKLQRFGAWVTNATTPESRAASEQQYGMVRDPAEIAMNSARQRLASGLQNPANVAAATDQVNKIQNKVFSDKSKDPNITPPDTSAYDRATGALQKYIEVTNAATASVNAGVYEQEKLKAIAELTAAGIKDKLTPAAAAAKAEMSGLGDKAGAAALALAKAKVASEIQFGANTSLLSQGDVQIATQLKGLYPDVATALGSVEAQGLRTNAALKEISSTLENNLTSGLTDIVSGTKSVSQGFSDMATAIVKDIEQMIIKIAIVQPLMQSLQASASSLGIGGFTGALNANGSIMGAVGPTSVGGAPLVGLHDGGIVGSEATFRRYVHPAYFDDAPRFHTGGIAGDEVPIIAKRGEGIFTPAQMAAMGGSGSSQPITVNLIEDSSRAGQVEQKQNSNGGMDINAYVDSITAKNAANPGSATSQVLNQRGRLASR